MAVQVDFRIAPEDQFTLFDPSTKKNKTVTYFTLLAKIRGAVGGSAVGGGFSPSITEPLNNQLIVYNSQEDQWENRSVGIFNRLIVSGQTDVVASSLTNSLTFVGGTGVTIATNPTTDTITINSTVGTVTSVDMSVPTGFDISGNPVTTSGTLALGFDTGYSLPTDATQATWTAAYNETITSAAFDTTDGVITLTKRDTNTITVDIDGRFIPLSQRAAANGVATLDGGGKIPTSQLPSSVFLYLGTWNANTNTPTLADGTGTSGDVYRVSVAGTQNLGSGSISFEIGDLCIYDGAVWQKSDSTDAVTSVNGLTGTVVLDIDDINDVDISSIADGQYLTYQASTGNWVNTTQATADPASNVLIACKNTSGSTINKGTPVYKTGTVGATNVIEIAPAEAGDATKMPAVGLLTGDLVQNGTGYVIVTGELLHLITSPIDGSTPSINDTIYVKSSGGLTLTKPQGSTNLIQNMGLVGKVSTGNSGSLTVSSIMRSNDVPNLPTGKVWVGTATNTAASSFIHLDEANNRLGVNTSSPSKTLEVDGDISINTSSGNKGIRIITEATAEGYLIFGDADDNSMGGIAYNNNTNALSIDANNAERITILSSGNVGIGTNNPGSLLHIDGSRTTDLLQVNQTGTGIIANFKQAGNSKIVIDNDGDLGIGTTLPSSKLHISGISQTGTSTVFRIENDTNNTKFLINSVSGDYNLQFKNAGNSVKVLLNSNGDSYLNGGNVGIGASNPQEKLEVAGNVKLTGSIMDIKLIESDTTDVNSLIRQQTGLFRIDTISDDENTITRRFTIDNSDGQVQLNSYGSGTHTGTAVKNLQIDSSGNIIETAPAGGGISGGGAATRVTFWSAASVLSSDSDFYWDNTNKRLGIGTDSPSSKLTVGGNGVTTLNPTAIITDTTNGGSLVLRGQSPILAFDKTSTGVPKILMDTGGLQFKTGTLDSEGDIDMVILSDGNVGIGTATPISLLEISKQLSAASTIDYPYTISSRDDGNTINQVGGEGVGIKFRIAGNDATTPGNSMVGASIAAIREVASDSDSSTGLGFFVTQNDETLDEAVRINRDGKVGIGIDSPTANLEIQSATSSDAFVIKEGTNSSFKMEIDSNDDAVYKMYSNGEQGQVQISTAGDSYFNGGDFGIGNTNPSTKLHVTGTAKFTGDTSIGTTSSAFLQLLRAGSNYIAASNASGELVFRTGGSTAALTLNASQNATFAGSVTTAGAVTIANTSVSQTSPTTQLLFDHNNIDNGGGYNIDFKSSSNDTANRFMARIQALRGSGAISSLGFFTETGSALTRALLLDSSQNATFSGNVTLNSRLTFDYGGDHYFEAGTNTIAYKSSTGSSIMTLNASTSVATFAGDARFNSRVRIGDVTGLSNRGTVRIDTRGDAPADLLFGRDTAGTATSWSGVYWSLSSRSSSDSNAFRIYRGTSHSSPYNSEAVLLQLNPDLSATFAGSLKLSAYGSGTITGTPVKALAVDSSGNVIERTLGVNGSGVATRVAFWDGTNSISSTANLYWDNTNNILELADDSKVAFGADNDLQIYHDGTDSYIKTSIGNLIIQNGLNDADIVFKAYNSAGSLATYFDIDGSAGVTKFRINTRHLDNVKANFGQGSDLTIFHDGSNSYIKTASSSTGDLFITSQGSGHDLYLEAADDIYLRPQGTENGVVIVGNGDVTLYYDNVAKLSTTSAGVTVSGAITTNLSSEGTYFTGGSGNIRQLSITSGTNVSSHALHTFNIASGNGKYKFDINGTEEFSIDSSNATFSGDVTISSASAPVLRFTNTTGSQSWIQYVGSNDDFIIRDETDARSPLIINGSGNTTFAGDVTINGNVNPETLEFFDLNGTVTSRFKIYAWDNELQFTKRNLSSGAYDGSILALDYSDDSATFAGDIEVNGVEVNIDSATHATLTLDRASTSYDNNIMFKTAADTKFRIWQDGNSDYLYIRDDDNATNMVTFKKGGNVGIGIGSADPDTRLELLSTAANVDRTIPHNILTITAESGNLPYTGFGGAIIFKNRSYSYGLLNSARIRSVIDSDSSSNRGAGLAFDVTNSSQTYNTSLFLKYNGNVGIGTSSPNRNLQVAGNFAITDSSDTSSVLIIPSSLVNNIYSRESQGANSSIPLAVRMDTSEVFRIDSAGKVGIGTGASVDANLHVVGTDIKLQGVGIAGDLTFAYNAGNNSTTIADVNYANINATVTSGSTGSESGKLSFQTRNVGTVADRMTIDSSGNLGVGTSSPSLNTAYDRVLHIHSTLGSLVKLTDATSGSATGDGTELLNYGNDTFLINRDSGVMAFLNNGSERMRISDAGEVLIGQTSNLTNQKLQVNGFIDITDITSTALRWYDGTTFRGGLGLDDWAMSGSSSDINMYVAGNNSFFVTTNNTKRVEFDGLGSIKFNAYDSTNNTGTPTYLLGTDGSGNIVKTLATPGGIPTQHNLKSKAYTSLVGSPSSGNWYKIFTITDAMGPVNCKIFTYAHDCLEFSVAEGYGPSNAGSITVINSVHTSNSGYATVSEVRIDQNGVVSIKLVWSSGPSVNIGINITGYNVPNLMPTLSVNTSTTTVVDSVNVDVVGIVRSKKQLRAGSNVLFDTSGNSYINGGNVGIGVGNPNNRLDIDSNSTNSVHIQGTGSFNLYSYHDSGGVGWATGSGTSFTNLVYMDSSNNIRTYTNGTEKMRVTSGGLVGIGMTPNTAGSSTYMLQMYNPGSQCFLSIGNGTSGSGPLNGLVIGNDANAAYLLNREATPLLLYTSNTERMRILSGGNVGIGETNPLVPLHISRDSASGENIALLLDNNNTTAGNEIGILFRSNAGSTNTDFEIFGKANAANDMDLVFQSDGSNERMRITSAGELELTQSNAEFDFTSSSSSGYKTTFNMDNTGLDIGHNSGGRALNLQTNSADRLTITGGGNVGIGTSTPNVALQVNQSASVPLLVHRPNNTSFDPHGIGFSTRSDAVNGGLGDVRSGIFSDYNGDLFLAANTSSITSNPAASSRLFIEGSNGYVGIGASPTVKFEVNGPNLGTSINNTASQALFRASNANNSQLYIQDYRTSAGTDWTSSGRRLQMKIDSTWMGWMQFNGTGNNGGISWGTGTSTTQASVTEKMILKSNGNLGIGTNNPTGKLTISGSGTSTAPTISITNTSSGTFNHSINAFAPNLTSGESNILIFGRAGSTKNSAYVGYRYSGTAGSNNNLLILGHWGSDNLMTITGGGNVGIGTGTTIPVPKLHLVYSGGSYGTDATSGFINQADTGRSTTRLRSITDDASELFFDVNGAIRWDISARGSSQSHTLNFYPAASTPVYNSVSAHILELQQNGNVVVTGNGISGNMGIGNNNPLQKLDVSGNISLGNWTKAGSTYVGLRRLDNGAFGSSGDSGLVIESYNHASPYAGNYSQRVHLRSHLYNGGSHNVLTAYGLNVGIGTSTPAEKLEVVGNAMLDASSARLKIKGGTTGTNSGIDWTFNSDTTVYAKMELNYNDRATTGLLIDSGYPMTIDYSSSRFAIRYNGTEQMRIDSSGNVGIGNTSPANKLSVNLTSSVALANQPAVPLFVGNNSNSVDGRVFIDVKHDSINGASAIGAGLRMQAGAVTTGTASYNSSLIFLQSAAPGSNTIHSAPKAIKFYVDNHDTAAGSGANYNAFGDLAMTIAESTQVGIGTTSPSEKLDVAGNIHLSANQSYISFNTSGSSGHPKIRMESDGDFSFLNTAGALSMRIENGGNVGIGTNNPSYPLHVNSNVSNVSIYASADIAAFSDARVKDNIISISDPVEKIKAIRGVTYQRTDLDSEKRFMGVIAQEVLPHVPEVVHEDEKGMYSVSYQNMVALLIEGMKEQQEQIDELKEQVKKLSK